jgi:hypothetical protein
VDKFSLGSFALRTLFALLLVFLTFNPSGYSFVHLVAQDFPSVTPIEAVCGVLLLIGWIVFLGATFRAIGMIGVLLIVALFAALVWLLSSWGWLTLENTHALSWIGLVVLAFVLAVGMSWSHLYRRWSGQQTVDEVNER